MVYCFHLLSFTHFLKNLVWHLLRSHGESWAGHACLSWSSAVEGGQREVSALISLRVRQQMLMRRPWPAACPAPALFLLCVELLSWQVLDEAVNYQSWISVSSSMNWSNKECSDRSVHRGSSSLPAESVLCDGPPPPLNGADYWPNDPIRRHWWTNCWLFIKTLEVWILWEWIVYGFCCCSGQGIDYGWL